MNRSCQRFSMQARIIFSRSVLADSRINSQNADRNVAADPA